MTTKKVLTIAQTLFLSVALVLTLAQCSEEQIVVEQPTVEDTATAMASESPDVASISVAGLYTEIKGDVQCKTCTYVVDPRKTTVDGKELGLEPGSVVCLKKGLTYSALDFINIEGTEDNPIVIGYCAE